MPRRCLVVAVLLFALVATPASAGAGSGAGGTNGGSSGFWPLVFSLLWKEQGEPSQTVRISPHPAFPQAKFAVAKTPVTVDITRKQPFTRGLFGVRSSGAAEGRMVLVCDVGWVVDLDRVRPADVQWDANRRMLTVRLPPPAIDSVTPDLPNRQFDLKYTGIAFEFLDSAEGRMVLDDCLNAIQPEARRAAEAHRSNVEKISREQLKELLEKLLRPHFSDLTVIVN
jgi:hypothetical protein